MTQKTLKDMRKKIDRVDAAIIKLLAERRKLSRAVGRMKAKAGIVVKDPARERAILKHYRTQSKRHRLDPTFVHQLFRSIIRYSRSVQK
ncbi:MAG: chorismate mutase [Deltaproteobacteria bacterium CG11_big_fil_rev_8_21_14_0_20_47_16]|nr:MAG: chorismate mutase [Deltaproteobacteria bacterium CG11_big_fil_rev_8_21_14_0_20_47_16]